MALELSGASPHGGELVAELHLGDFGATRSLLHGFQFVAKPLDLGLACCAAVAEVIEFAAQGLVARADVGQRRPKLSDFFLLQRPQRLVDGIDQLAEGILEVVQRADLAAGVDQ